MPQSDQLNLRPVMTQSHLGAEFKIVNAEGMERQDSFLSVVLHTMWQFPLVRLNLMTVLEKPAAGGLAEALRKFYVVER